MKPSESNKEIGSKKISGKKSVKKNMQASVYDLQGKKIDSIELAEHIFGVDVKPEIIARAVRVQKNGSRTPLGHTKTRSERRGGGRKPWKQKGTGRARHGSTRSPIWRKGGITFGPRNNKNFSIKINVKERIGAILGSLTLQAAEKDGLAVIDNVKLEKIKTNTLGTLLEKLPAKRSSLLVTSTSDNKLVLSARNIPNFKVQTVSNLNILDILSFDRLLISRKGLALLTKKYSRK